MHRKVFLEVNDTDMVYREVPNKNFIFNLFNSRVINKNIVSIKGIKVNLKNRNLVILAHGEEVYVMLMKLPRVNRTNIFKIIREELKNKFKRTDDIMFSYDIIRRCKYNLEVMVFCMNYRNGKVIEECHNAGFHIAGIVPIQFYIWENYKDKIKSENYIFVLMRNEVLYFIACHKCKMIFNNVFKNIKKDDFFDILEQFQMKLSILMTDFKFTYIYFVGFPYKDTIEEVSKQYICKDFGKFIVK
jgi:hypothetical protein